MSKIVQFSERDDIQEAFQTDGVTITIDKDFECKGNLTAFGFIEAKKNVTVIGSVSSGTGTENVILQGGEIVAAGQISAKNVNITSDKRAKLEIEDIDQGVVKSLSRLVPKQYSFVQNKTQDKETHFGFIAQELEEVYPQMVREIGGVKRIDYIELIPLLVSTVNRLVHDLDVSNEKTSLLERKIKIMEEKMAL